MLNPRMYLLDADWAGGWCSPCCAENVYIVCAVQTVQDGGGTDDISGFVVLLDDEGTLQWSFDCDTLNGEYESNVYHPRNVDFGSDGAIYVELAYGTNASMHGGGGATLGILKLSFAGVFQWFTSLGTINPAFYPSAYAYGGGSDNSFGRPYWQGNLRLDSSDNVVLAHQSFTGGEYISITDSAGNILNQFSSDNIDWSATSITTPWQPSWGGTNITYRNIPLGMDIDRTDKIWFSVPDGARALGLATTVGPWFRMSQDGVVDFYNRDHIFTQLDIQIVLEYDIPDASGIGCDPSTNTVYAGGGPEEFFGEKVWIALDYDASVENFSYSSNLSIPSDVDSLNPASTINVVRSGLFAGVLSGAGGDPGDFRYTFDTLGTYGGAFSKDAIRTAGDQSVFVFCEAGVSPSIAVINSWTYTLNGTIVPSGYTAIPFAMSSYRAVS